MTSRSITPPTRPAARRPSRAARIRAWIGRAEADSELTIAGVLDLFEEHFYVGEITAEGRYVSQSSSPTATRILGGSLPPGPQPERSRRTRCSSAL